MFIFNFDHSLFFKKSNKTEGWSN